MRSSTHLGLAVLAVVALSASALADARLFNVDRCNPALHDGYDAFLAPYRAPNPPAFPPGVLIVGGSAGPNEYVLGPGVSTEPYNVIFVINDGTIAVTGMADPPAIIASKIVLLDQAEFLAVDANIHFVEHGLPGNANDPLDAAGNGTVMFEVADHASLTIAYSNVSLGDVHPGYLRLVACGSSNVMLAYNDFSVQGDSCEVARTRPTTEVFPFSFDNATVTVAEAPERQSALYEVSAGGNSTVNLFDLEDPGAGAYFIVDADIIEPVHGREIVLADQTYRLVDAVGNGPTIHAINSGLLWGFWLEPGARLRIEESQIGLWFKADGDLQIDALQSGPWGENGQPKTMALPNQDIEVTIVDSHVVETNAYFRGTGEKRMSHSVVGDTNCGGSGHCIIRESVVTGAGGDYSTVFGDALTIYELSSHRMGFFARDDAVAIFDLTTIESHPGNPSANRFKASDRALIALQNAIFAPAGDYPHSTCQTADLGEYVCEVEDDGAIAYATILSPGFGAFVRASQRVFGTAAVTSSPESFWAFDHYDLWLEDANGKEQVLVHGSKTQVAPPGSSLCRTGSASLGFLDVSGLSPGSLYTLHLAVFNRAGWSVAKTENSFVYFPVQKPRSRITSPTVRGSLGGNER